MKTIQISGPTSALKHSGASLPVLSEWTADVATNITETAADVAGGRGIILVHTSATASTRLSTRYKAGTKIVGWFTALVPGTTDASQVQGFAVLCLSRPLTDNRKVHVAIGPSASAGVGTVIRTSRWTDKDNIVAVLGTAKPVTAMARIGLYIEFAAGNVNAGYTLDGVNFTQTYTDTVLNAFGAIGDPTRVEFGTALTVNGMIGHILLEGVTVT